MLRYVHSEKQNRNQTEIQYRHYPALGWCDFEVTLFFLSSFAEKRIGRRQRQQYNQPDNKIRILPAEPKKESEPGQPQPARQRDENGCGEHFTQEITD